MTNMYTKSMKIIVAHASPDLDAITSIWLLKKFLPGWENAEVRFVPAGERIGNQKSQTINHQSQIEQIGEDEVIHVDTGLGPLDHHQTSDMNVCAASLTFEYVKSKNPEFKIQNSEKIQDREEALGRIVKIVVDVDHFQEIFWDNSAADYHEFSVLGIIEGIKYQKPDQDEYYVNFISQCLDALLHDFENKIWAEKEIEEKGIIFKTKWGKNLAIETINDTVIKLAQKMGYAIVVRKDPRKGYVRIKARPLRKRLIASSAEEKKLSPNRDMLDVDIDLTLVYEQLRKMDPEASWFLHVSKKMLLNGTAKNPSMVPSKLSLNDIIKVLEKV